MVLIFSNDFEVNTPNVIDWLIHYKAEYIRINFDDGFTEELSVNIDNSTPTPEFVIKYKGNEINSKDIKSFWYRRGSIPPLRKQSSTNIFNSRIFNNKLASYLELEYKVLVQFMHDLLDDIPIRLGSRLTASVNKLKVLKLAIEIGIQVPDTLITTSTSKIRVLKNKHKGIITKAIDNLFIAEKFGRRMLFYTEELSEATIDELPETIFPSLIQEKLEKKYELRIFYLNGEFYPMAIFSQQDETTTVDFRNYNMQKPNRTVPFNLPEAIKEKLTILMDRLSLQTGSIDIVVTTKNEYVFLEVNPVGQFAQVAGPCNYPLYRKIAQYLSSYEH
ncbi:grasp-with-spasm system ATP-grasp peptide maturase [Pedobacter sp. R20-19]|uniref:grasp-with-spasm system ATP-grasp peptide maturase n=1 Tax=Pedobacter sp. R20-19 TaxID=1270196 RepID=UPI000492FD58|nr:grasp-with-spasm system ATP-grasp peptide maturase [Pedobacter sp. R20-19]